MPMRQRGSNILKEWLLLGGWMVLLHGALILGWIALDPILRTNPTPFILLIFAYVAGLTIGMFIFYRRLSRVTYPLEYEQARAEGIPATAKVLEIRRTRWRNPRTRNFRLQVTPMRWEYEMRVRVSPPDGQAYEAELAEYLREPPQKGQQIAVKIHPQHPEIIVFAQE